MSERTQGTLLQALTRLRAAVWCIFDDEGVETVLAGFRDALVELGIDFLYCSIAIVNEEQGVFERLYISPANMSDRSVVPLEGTAAFAAWNTGSVLYRCDIEEEDRYDERQRHWREPDQEIRSVVDVPFSLGTVAINSGRPNAFTPEQIDQVKALAGVVEAAYERLAFVQKQAVDAERYRVIFHNATAAIALVNQEDGSFVEFNEETCEMLGYTREELYSMTIFDIEESRAEIKRRMERILRSGGINFETQQRRKDGTELQVWVSTKTIEVGDHRYIQTLWRDITQQKETERRLNEYFEEEQSRPIPDMKKRVGTRVKSRRRFLKMSQEELAGKIGKTSGYISQVENGLTGLKLQVLAECADALGVSPSYFVRSGSFEQRRNGLDPFLQDHEVILARIVEEGRDWSHERMSFMLNGFLSAMQLSDEEAELIMRLVEHLAGRRLPSGSRDLADVEQWAAGGQS